MLKTMTIKMICAAGLMFMPLWAAHASTPGSVQVSVKDYYSSDPVAGAAVLMNPGNYALSPMITEPCFSVISYLTATTV